jgi:hypothetical protein
VQLSLLGWPPLLSHSLAFIVGTLVLQRGEAGMSVPNGKVLIPAAKVGKLEVDGKPWKETNLVTLLQKRGEEWCRTAEDELKLWKAPGRGGDLYVLWPAGAAFGSKLQQVMQKKTVFTADGKKFAFCGSEEGGSMISSGVQYD